MIARIRICKEEGCHDAATTGGYCRLHYLKRWKQLKQEERKIAARKLNRYIERMCRENPDDYLEAIRQDLKNRDFERELDFGDADDTEHGFEDTYSDEDVQNLIRKLKVEKGY